MGKEVVGYCPICNNKLVATKLTCKRCNLDLSADFSLNRFSYLDKEEQEFIYLFLSSEGSFKEVQAKLNLSYAKAKQCLSDILTKLELKKEENLAENVDTEKGTNTDHIADNDHFIVRRIKEKLSGPGGKAIIPLIQAGKTATIGFDKNGKGLVCDKIPIPNQLRWEAFIAAYDIAVAQDGTLYKGYARAGKLGSEKLPINSLEGYIAHTVHGVKEGESAFSPGFVIAAVLDWIGVFKNERGSNVKLRTDVVTVETYEDALKNARTFISGLNGSKVVQERLNQFRHWYYFEELDGFAPCKFIGYKDMSLKVYEINSRETMDGKIAIKALDFLFSQETAAKNSKRYEKLVSFLENYGMKPNSGAVIHER